MSGNEIEELKEQTQTGDRIDDEPSRPDDQDEGDDQDPFVDAIISELEAIDDDASPNLTLRDENMAALIRALEVTERLDDLGRTLDRARDEEPQEDYTKADIGRASIRLALEREAPELLDDLEEAVASQMQI